MQAKTASARPDDLGQDEEFPLLTAVRHRLWRAIKDGAGDSEGGPELRKLLRWFNSIIEAQNGGETGEQRVSFRDHLQADFIRHMAEAGITSGAIAEIGGPHNSFANLMPTFDFSFLSIFPNEQFDNVILADATLCDEVPSESFDAIFSVSVFEHISKPWKAAEQLTRLLKPGGIMYHAAPFSYFYHGAPADFWRFTPDAFRLMFSSLEPLHEGFYGRNRRRDNRGSESNRVDRDGGPQFAVDGFGGWRENWYTIYVGRKNAEHERTVREQNEKQAVVNLVKVRTLRGDSDQQAIETVTARLPELAVDIDGDVERVAAGRGMSFTIEEVTTLWNRRGKLGLKPTFSRYVMAAKAGL